MTDPSKATFTEPKRIAKEQLPGSVVSYTRLLTRKEVTIPGVRIAVDVKVTIVWKVSGNPERHRFPLICKQIDNSVIKMVEKMSPMEIFVTRWRRHWIRTLAHTAIGLFKGASLMHLFPSFMQKKPEVFRIVQIIRDVLKSRIRKDRGRRKLNTGYSTQHTLCYYV